MLSAVCLIGVLLSLVCGQGAPTRSTISEESTTTVVPVPTKAPTGPPNPPAAQPIPPIPNTTPYYPPDDMPTLGDVPGQRYIGQVIVEIREQGSGFEPRSALTGNSYPAPSVRTALAALEGRTNHPSAPATWPDFSLFKGGIRAPVFRGRVVVEVWESTTSAAVTVADDSVDDLIQRATGGLQDAVQYGAQ